MTAAKYRRPRDSERSPAVPLEERQAILLRTFRSDLVYWIGADQKTALRIMRLVEEVLRDPFSGMGKPEPLRHDMQGQWSRRITPEDRIVYRVRPGGILFSFARGHYGRR
ncbi:Txe/YoeB family addiction module toxin [Longimicrobium sp.]|uniref:Txe/YoeB family addiction module toxin n=1 Tax=Longimicrobium sp. TaxID=2029185 RepID=UPI002E36017D|nr:Txe/YoeB family addiction module toxin [Longimicrobium sp.]HEX6037116.1 Txe/YoeB family addiction module toxin [Longimicrobium sp.]